MLSAARMAQMSRLLDEALELDPEARRRWLEALPSEHRDLEPILRQALFPSQRQAATAEAMATLPKIAAVGTTQVVSGLQAGELVGPYRLLCPVGAGGMAEVWLAERADGILKREVALKLPILTRLRKDLASRFARERDILAALEHPNIARLYDAGVAADGLPYLAMEYVRGEPLTRWCDAHHLDIPERLKLFLQVLDAVQHAHVHQVIHRDIKPSNILVTDSGQVRLLDFGVAKLLARDEQQTELTQLYGQALTPEYASPELVRGDPIDAAADVYSLGVLLYELLSGNRPYRLKAGASPALLEQAIATAQVENPSTQVARDAASARGTTQEKLARRLKGDLDAIVLKALAKAPADRYSSAAALADDLKRYLAGEPVEAARHQFAYRFTKFALRHRAGVATGAAVAVLITAIAGYLLTHGPLTGASSEATRAGSPSQAQSSPIPDDKSIAVLPFVDMSEKKDQEYFSDGLSEELIDRLSRSADLKVIARTSSFYYRDKPATIGEIASALNVSHVLEGSVRKSGQQLRITAQLIRASDGSRVWSQTYERKLADIFKVQDDIAGTVAAALKAALNGNSSAQPSSTNVEAYNLLLQGNYLWARNTKDDMNRAVKFYQKAIELDPNYALAWARMGRLYADQAAYGWIPVAEGVQKARAAAEQALKLNPDFAGAHSVMGNLSRNFDWDWNAARQQYQRAFELAPDDLRIAAAVAYVNEGIYGRLDGGIEIERKLIARDPLDVVTIGGLAFDLFLAGRYEEAVATAERLVALDPSHAAAYSNMADSLLYLGRLDQALDAAKREADEPERLSTLPVVYWALGRKAESDAALAELETKYAAVAAYQAAEMHAYREEIDLAFRWLDHFHRHPLQVMSAVT
jgi:serine/threonine protein kinase